MRLKPLPKGFQRDVNLIHRHLLNLLYLYYGDEVKRMAEVVSTPDVGKKGRHKTEINMPDIVDRSGDVWRWGIFWSDPHKAMQHCSMEWLENKKYVEKYFIEYEEVFDNNDEEKFTYLK